jgi:hypothetical protein
VAALVEALQNQVPVLRGQIHLLVCQYQVRLLEVVLVQQETQVLALLQQVTADQVVVRVHMGLRQIFMELEQ